MIPRDREAWRRAMGEAASLPADDRQRMEMQSEVSRLGAWAEAEWLALLQEGERWRLELARVDVPEGLEDRLLRIPEDSRGVGLAGVISHPRLAWIGIAAALLLVAGAWVFATSRSSRPTPVEIVAHLAMIDHLETHGLEVSGRVPAEVASGLKDRIPFEIQFPSFEEELRLEGGRRCTLGSHPVCFSTWRRGDVRFTLIQLRRADFDLEAGLPPTIVKPKGAAGGRRHLDVLVWSEGEFGWALVADDSAALASIHPRGR